MMVAWERVGESMLRMGLTEDWLKNLECGIPGNAEKLETEKIADDAGDERESRALDTHL